MTRTTIHDVAERAGVSIATVSRVLAQDPWTASANNLKTTFTGPIATALIAVAVVITGMTFAFSEGQGKRQLTGLLFGGAMALWRGSLHGVDLHVNLCGRRTVP